MLVAGLLVIGALAARDGIFEAAGALAARAPGGGATLLVLLLALDALVTVVLNLDTAVVFLTPILVHAARRRGLGEAPFLYGSVFMANAASLLLPGSNLTNLIVLAREHVAGARFAALMLPAWGASVVVVTVGLVAIFRRPLSAAARHDGSQAGARLGAGAAGVAGAAALVLVLHDPALPVLGLAVALAALGRAKPRAVARAANPLLLLGVFGVAVGLGTLARSIHWLATLTTHTGRWASAGVATLAAVLVNNLPAAVMLSARTPAHPRALLVGLDVGPNLAITGSLSAVLWLQVGRAAGARPSVRRYSLLGLVLAPAGIAAALGLVTLLDSVGY